MKKYSVTVMHPGGTTYNYTVVANRFYFDHDSIVFVKDGGGVEIYPQGLTIVKGEE